MPALLRVPSAVPGSLREALQICAAHLSMSFGEKGDCASNSVYPEVTTDRQQPQTRSGTPKFRCPELHRATQVPSYPATRCRHGASSALHSIDIAGCRLEPWQGHTRSQFTKLSVKTPNFFPTRMPPTIMPQEAIRSNLLLNELPPAWVENDCR